MRGLDSDWGLHIDELHVSVVQHLNGFLYLMDLYLRVGLLNKTFDCCLHNALV